VERPFEYVETSLLNGRTFRGLAHLNEAAAWWLAEVADVRTHRQTKARPLDRHAEEQPHLVPLPTRPFDASEVVYRTVDAEGFAVYRQNFYAAPWRLLGQSVAVRVTEDEVVIHDRLFVEATRHPLFPRTVAGQRSCRKEHEPPRDAQRRSEQLAAHFAQFGAAGTQFLEGLLAANRFGKSQAGRVLALVAVYPRSDVTAAPERAVRYGTAPSAWRPSGAFSQRGASPGRRWTPWPTTTAPTSTGSSRVRRHRRDPPPTTRPCWARNPTMPRRPTPKSPSAPNRRTPAARKPVTPSLHENVTAALRTLGVALAPGVLDAALSAAEKESLSHLEFLHRLLAGPAEARLQRALERRISAAKFPELTTLEGFDWEFNAKGLDRRSIEQLATCDFVRRHENAILVGQTGLGKSRILQAVGHAACVQGYRVRYASSAKLLQEFTAALADGTCNRMLAGYARLDLLLIDEFGFDRLEREAQAQASTFYYRLLDARTGRRSTALATNIDFSALGRLPGRPTAGDRVSRPPGRRCGDPQTHRPLLPRPSRPPGRRTGRYRTGLTTLVGPEIPWLPSPPRTRSRLRPGYRTGALTPSSNDSRRNRSGGTHRTERAAPFLTETDTSSDRQPSGEVKRHEGSPRIAVKPCFQSACDMKTKKPRLVVRRGIRVPPVGLEPTTR
jgi:DNA replication protein DnaC